MDSIAKSHIRKVTIQGCRDRLTIPQKKADDYTFQDAKKKDENPPEQ